MEGKYLVAIHFEDTFHIGQLYTSCKCSIMNLPVDFELKDTNGKVLKRFSILGPQNVDRILLWIWRDLLVSLFATGSDRDKARVPEFLEEIQETLGISALERLLYGGEPSKSQVL